MILVDGMMMMIEQVTARENQEKLVVKRDKEKAVLESREQREMVDIWRIRKHMVGIIKAEDKVKESQKHMMTEMVGIVLRDHKDRKEIQDIQVTKKRKGKVKGTQENMTAIMKREFLKKSDIIKVIMIAEKEQVLVKKTVMRKAEAIKVNQKTKECHTTKKWTGQTEIVREQREIQDGAKRKLGTQQVEELMTETVTKSHTREAQEIEKQMAGLSKRNVNTTAKESSVTPKRRITVNQNRKTVSRGEKKWLVVVEDMYSKETVRQKTMNPVESTSRINKVQCNAKQVTRKDPMDIKI